jgi:hypothetical protein
VEGAQRTWEVIAAQGQKLLKEGRPLESAEENLAELGAQAKTFHEAVLPVLRGLGVA